MEEQSRADDDDDRDGHVQADDHRSRDPEGHLGQPAITAGINRRPRRGPAKTRAHDTRKPGAKRDREDESSPANRPGAAELHERHE